MPQVTPVFASTPLRGAVLTLILGIAGCSTVSNSDDTIDYGTAARKTPPLSVPPDLSKLALDGRYAPQGGSVSANALQNKTGGAPVAATGTTPQVALNQVADLRLQRQGSQRWLLSSRSPEVLWPQVRDFWLDLGFKLEVDDAAAGLLETDWAENRAKLPKDIIRRTLGWLIDSAYSTGERDRFRVRLERTDQGTEIHVAHKGVKEVFNNAKDSTDGTVWTARPADPELEAEVLVRLMIALGSPAPAARDAMAQQASAASTVASTPAATVTEANARARVLTGQAAAALQLDDTLDRGWRRLGLALDRTGFTVEERDRSVGLYAVRYVDPVEAAKESPGFFARMFGAKDPVKDALGRYRIVIKADGASRCTISVFTPQGQPDASTSAQRIVQTLVDELKN